MDMQKLTNLESNRKRAILLLRIESLMVLSLVLFLLIAPLVSSVTAVESLGAEIFFGILGSAGLWFSSVGFSKQKSFGRAPAVLANLIALGVSYYMISGALIVVGIPLAVLSVITLFSAAFGYKE